MKLTTTIECTCRASAQIAEDNTLSLKVFAEAEYAPGRTTTADVQLSELPPAIVSAVQVALAAARDAAAALLGARIQQSVHKSAEVAAAHGEI